MHPLSKLNPFLSEHKFWATRVRESRELDSGWWQVDIQGDTRLRSTVRKGVLVCSGSSTAGCLPCARGLQVQLVICHTAGSQEQPDTAATLSFLCAPACGLEVSNLPSFCS